LGPGLLSISPHISIDFLLENVYFGILLCLNLSSMGGFLTFGFFLFFFLVLMFTHMVLVFLFFV
jgi:hypothetical protein